MIWVFYFRSSYSRYDNIRFTRKDFTLLYFIQNWPCMIVPPIEVIRATMGENKTREVRRERRARKLLGAWPKFLVCRLRAHNVARPVLGRPCRAISVCRSSQRELIHTLLSNVGANKRGGDPHNLTN